MRTAVDPVRFRINKIRPQQQQQLLLLAQALLTAVCLCCAVQQAVGASSVNVSSSRELLAALQQPAVDQIVLQNDVRLGAEFDRFAGTPLQITRNVTVTGTASDSSRNRDALPLLDMQNKIGILQLCSSCIFAFVGVSFANENPTSTGGIMTAFLGQRGSRIEWEGGVTLRRACPPARLSLPLFNQTQRSVLFPGSGGSQLIDLVNITYRGKTYQDALNATDLTIDIAPQRLIQSADALTGGYGIRRRGAIRVCEYTVSPQCLQQKLPEDCIAELLAGGGSRAGSQTGPQHIAVAVAVPVSVAGLLVAAALILWRRRQRRQRQHHSQLPLQAAAPSHQGAAGSTGLLATADLDVGVQSGADQGLQREGSRAALSKQLSSSSLQQTSLLGSEAWQLIWSSSAVSTDRPAWHPQDNIELGVLLGAGSFARVYKGRWSGLDVAVKVIYHGPESVSTVANEVQLMLSLNHPNIIRAYHCVTKQLVAAQLPTSHSVSQPPQLPVQLAGRGSTGSSGPQHLPASGSTASAAVQSALLQGVEVTALRQSSSIMTASSALSAVQPSTPPLAGLEPPAAASAAASAKSGTGTQSLSQAGLTSSSGVGSFVSDLEHPAPSSSLLQAYQRKGNLGQQMQPSLAAAAAVSTPVGSSAFAGAAAQQQQQQEQDDAAAGSSFTASAAAADVRSIGPGPGYAVMTLPQAAASGPAAAVHPTPSLPVVGSGAVRPQAQQFLAPSLSTGSTAAAAPAAPGPGPSIPSSSSSGPSRGSLGSLAWPLIMSSRDASEALGVQGGGPQPEGSAYLANRNSAAGNVVGGGDVDTWRTERDATALVETWLVTELADRGTLARQASQWQPESNEQDMLRLLHLLRDVACGLKMLKSQHIVHADLNAHNVLVSSSPVARYGLVAKVADLGLSRILKQQATHRTTRTIGMLSHQPPELLRDGRMSPAVDIYSFGIMMFECCTRQAAYARMRYGQIYHQVVVLGAHPAVPADGTVPEDYELLMRRCWSTDASARPSVDMLLECLDLMIQHRQEQAASGSAGDAVADAGSL